MLRRLQAGAARRAGSVAVRLVPRLFAQGESIVKACGREWHHDHLVCSSCAAGLANVEFYEHEGAPYCHECSAAEFQSCATCQKLITDKNMESIAVAGKVWCSPHCFSCKECATAIGDQRFFIGGDFLKGKGIAELLGQTAAAERNAGGQRRAIGRTRADDASVYCERDFFALFVPPCSKCGERFTAATAEESVSFGELVFHDSCLSCTSCSKTLDVDAKKADDMAVLGDDNKPYCDACWTREFGVECSGCGKVIVGEVLHAGAVSEGFGVFAPALPWHPACLRCYEPGCAAPLAEAAYYMVELDGQTKPLCLSHYLAKYNDSQCPGCHQKVSPEQGDPGDVLMINSPRPCGTLPAPRARYPSAWPWRCAYRALEPAIIATAVAAWTTTMTTSTRKRLCTARTMRTCPASSAECRLPRPQP